MLDKIKINKKKSKFLGKCKWILAVKDNNALWDLKKRGGKQYCKSTILQSKKKPIYTSKYIAIIAQKAVGGKKLCLSPGPLKADAQTEVAMQEMS